MLSTVSWGSYNERSAKASLGGVELQSLRSKECGWSLQEKGQETNCMASLREGESRVRNREAS